MIRLQGDKIHLRALEPEDLDFVHRIENDESMWTLGNTRTPFSRFVIRQYLENAHQDLHTARQLRLAICMQNQFEAIGLIDLYDFEPVHHRAGVGIVLEQEHRQSGYGSQALQLLIGYAFNTLGLHQIYAHIDPSNQASIGLFTTFGFLQCGQKMQWNLVDGQYRDELIYQLINNQSEY